MTEDLRRRNQRAAEYGRALARLRDLHRDEFDQLYAAERRNDEAVPASDQTDATAR
ncbi:MAG: hypothetical protein M3Q68_05645 [Actinomycetota bacterium]|nr:hypothetical protein [Actinomycetota bacterium]